ncbi:MAG: hypothetical protein WAN35_15335 [Terracidiphilus sp.]
MPETTKPEEIERRSDCFHNAREEAVTALVKRKDLRVLPTLIGLFRGDILSLLSEEKSAVLT